jgi:hypothetical protein
MCPVMCYQPTPLSWFLRQVPSFLNSLSHNLGTLSWAIETLSSYYSTSPALNFLPLKPSHVERSTTAPLRHENPRRPLLHPHPPHEATILTYLTALSNSSPHVVPFHGFDARTDGLVPTALPASLDSTVSLSTLSEATRTTTVASLSWLFTSASHVMSLPHLPLLLRWEEAPTMS